VVTSAAGAVIGIHSYYPFGAELELSPMEPSAPKFTGHERDNLPGGPLSLDYILMRLKNGTPLTAAEKKQIANLLTGGDEPKNEKPKGKKKPKAERKGKWSHDNDD
jgi:hypothetical protein